MRSVDIIAERKKANDLRRELNLRANDWLSFEDNGDGYGWYTAHMGEDRIYLGTTAKIAREKGIERIMAARRERAEWNKRSD